MNNLKFEKLYNSLKYMLLFKTCVLARFMELWNMGLTHAIRLCKGLSYRQTSKSLYGYSANRRFANKIIFQIQI